MSAGSARAAASERVLILLPEKGGKALMVRALEAGFHTFVAEGDPAELAGLARARILRIDAAGIHDGETLVAPRVVVASADDQTRALQLAGRHEAVLVDALDWRVIPYENLVAAYHGKGTRLFARAKDAEDARLLLQTLERGVDVVLLPAEHAAAAAGLLAAHHGPEALVEARVTAVRAIGMGDRACLDTASLLREGEGVLTGSSSAGLFLVASEARESQYVASRPFRVNAGAVHAYVLVPGGRTRYLSELRAGDEVLACDAQGNARPVVLGRVKIERRPFLLVEAEAEGRRIHVLLQNAETIRIVTPEGTKSVVDLAPGDVLLARIDEGGRHFGMRVDETVTER